MSETARIAEVAPSLRARYEAFVARHEVAWELGFAVLAIVFVVLGATESAVGEPAHLLEWAISIIFFVEFVSRLWAARSRRAYLRRHWVDVVALIPPSRGLRIFRLLRLLRLVRAFAGIVRAIDGLGRLTHHRGLAWLLAGWAGVVILTSIGMYVVEHGVNPAVHSGWDAAWWAVFTMTGVGGEIHPATAEGRVVGAVLMILGILLYSAVTAVVTSFLIRDERHPAVAADPIATIHRLAELHAAGHITTEHFETKREELLRRI